MHLPRRFYCLSLPIITCLGIFTCLHFPKLLTRSFSTLLGCASVQGPICDWLNDCETLTSRFQRYKQDTFTETEIYYSIEPRSSLLNAPNMQSWDLAKLRKPSCQETAIMTPAILMLHIFSTAFPSSVARRYLIRNHSPVSTIPAEYRHLVEVKFVVGSAASAHDQEILDAEQQEYGDLIQMNNLRNGENMDEGKSLDWARWVGQHSVREAWWVM